MTRDKKKKKKNPVNQLKFQARINMNLYKKKIWRDWSFDENNIQNIK